KHQVWKEWMYWSCNGEVGDMDNDGDNDIVLTGWGNKKWYWLENTGKDGEWPRHVIGKGDLKPHDVEIADFDLDGDIDVVVRSESWGNSSKEIIVCRQEKTAWSQKSLFTPLEGGGLDTADTDGDGDADIIIPGHWFQNPGGDIIGKDWPLHVFDPKTHLYAKVETGDINGDGRADIVVTQSEVAGTPKEKSGPIAWYAAPPDPEKGPWPKHIIEENVRRHHSLAIADMDCDGDLDIFTAEMGGKSLKRAEIKVWINEDKAKKWTKQVLAITGSHEANVFDLGNDGDMDVFGLNYTTTKLELWENKTDPPSILSSMHVTNSR
ncbi:MAG: FG-GAP repeat domain-containing protein, partial [Planctomycetota bacterium]